ncbi:MAG: type III-B CRISPR-associated protein Cas10/Cmr2, partial [Zetaproteobacteria bacterium]
MSGSDFWKAKIAAFLHDPLEKAFVLMRGESHERIADEAAREIFGEELLELRDQTKGLKDAIKRADWFASGADRPNLPRDFGGAPFWDKPEIVHPLTGKAIRLDEDLLGDFSKDEFKRMSAAHLARLANSFRENSEGGDHDWRAAFFALWRYGDEVSVGESSDKNKPKPNLWRVSPADSRTPDHGILEHLSLASAFTGASLSGKRPALLLVSFGPVQGFIAEARKMNDLWAGSHLLSAITFSAIWEVARRYGPDAV